MKQKIAIEVPVYDERRRSKAMQVAVTMEGVTSVSIESDTNLVVIGDGVDPVCLTASLRNKFDYANLVTVEEVKPPAQEEQPEEEVQPDAVIEWQPCYSNPYPYQYTQYYVCRNVCDADPSNCSIL